MRHAIRLLGGVAAVALAVLMFGSFSRSLVFFPHREATDALATTAAAAGLEPWINRAGERIGWRTSDGNDQAPLVILHGNAGHALHRKWLASQVAGADPSARWQIHILEYPGYADRAGTPSESALLAAAREGLATLSAPALLLGESIGTGVATRLAAIESERVRGLVLLTPFDSLVEVGRHHYPFLPVGWLLTERFDSVAALRQYQGPVAFLIAEQDEVTPASGGRRLAASYGGPKREWVVRGARHNDAAALLTDEQWGAALAFAAGRDAVP